MVNKTQLIEDLHAVKSVLVGGWTKGEVARNAENQAVGYDNPAATCFCTYGAAAKVAGHDTDRHKAVVWSLRRFVSDGLIAVWNDHPDTTLEMVTAVVDRAIANAEKE